MTSVTVGRSYCTSAGQFPVQCSVIGTRFLTSFNSLISASVVLQRSNSPSFSSCLTAHPTGFDGSPTGNPSVQSQDPFASQRTADNDPFSQDKLGALAGPDDMKMAGSPPRDRRMSKEWGESTTSKSASISQGGLLTPIPFLRGHRRVKGPSLSLPEACRQHLLDAQLARLAHGIRRAR